MVYEIYIFMCVLFLSVSVLRLENACRDLRDARSRETKSFMRIKIKRELRDAALSFVWPVRIWEILKSLYQTQKKENIIKLKKD